MNTFTASQAVNEAAADVTDVSSSSRNPSAAASVTSVTCSDRSLAASLKQVKGLAEMISDVPTNQHPNLLGGGDEQRRRFDRRCRQSAGTGHALLLADARHVTGHVSAGVQQAVSTWSFTTCVSVPGGSSAAPYLGSEGRSSKPSPFILLTPGATHRQPCRRCLA